MSKKILTVVTLTAVTIHVLLGCCWHHAHQASSTSADSAMLTECQCHGHLAKSHSEGRPADRHEHHGSHSCCDGVECIFYSTKDCRLELSVVSPFFLAITGDDFFTSLTISLQQTCGAEFSSGSVQPPEPLHALKQVWLI